MIKRIAAEVFPPGDFIREELDARGWTQGDLAAIMGRPLRTVNEIISAKKTITPESAIGLAQAFGTSAELWLNLESAYRLSLVKDEADEVARKAKIFSIAPINEMTKRGWIAPCNTAAELEQQVLDFFDISSIDEKPKTPFAARKSTSYCDMTQTQRAWFYRAKHLAKTIRTQGSFSKERFTHAIDELKALVRDVEEVRHVPRVLSEAGIRFLIVEHLSGSRIDGGTFWLSKKEPVVILSIRYDRIDGFWHTLGHELGHVAHEDDFSVDIDLVGEGPGTMAKPEFEIKADAFASEFTIPKSQLDDFIIRVRPLYSKKKIMGFATRIGVHPGIVVGQLQHRKEINYSHSREMLEKVRGLVTAVALTDGWRSTVRI